MIITRTPYRISFFGGGTDYPSWYQYHGGEVINCTLDKYIYISIKKLKKYFSHNYRISYSKVEEVNKVNQISHKVVRACLKKFGNNNLGYEIHYNGDLPSRSGMGSSSSFVVGLINSLYQMNGKKVNSSKLSKESIFLEQKILKETVGIQDQISCSYGGFNSIKINKKGNFKVKKIISDDKNLKNLSSNLLLIYTGRLRTAQIIANSYVKKLNNSKKFDLFEISKQVEIAKKILLAKDYDSFGKLLHETWLIKKNLSNLVSNSKIDDIYNECILKGALGGKLLGAGGGGFLLVYIKKNKIKELLNSLKGLTFLPVSLSNTKSCIIYNNEKN